MHPETPKPKRGRPPKVKGSRKKLYTATRTKHSTAAIKQRKRAQYWMKKAKQPQEIEQKEQSPDFEMNWDPSIDSQPYGYIDIDPIELSIKVFMSIISLVTIASVSLRKLNQSVINILDIWMPNFNRYWMASTSTMNRRVRGPMKAAILLFIALMVVSAGENITYTLGIDDTSKISDSYNAVTLQWTNIREMHHHYCIGYLNMCSKDAEGSTYSIKEILNRCVIFIINNQSIRHL